jgi:hypothetical protein
MPSFTLWPSGDDKSRISLHLFCLPFLGITPNGLQCTPTASATSGPNCAMRLCSSSFSRYLDTTCGCSAADGRFLGRDFSLQRSGLKPMRKPCWIPCHQMPCLDGHLAALTTSRAVGVWPCAPARQALASVVLPGMPPGSGAVWCTGIAPLALDVCVGGGGGGDCLYLIDTFRYIQICNTLYSNSASCSSLC